MTALAVTNPTLLDLANAMDPEGRISPVVEILNQTNEMLQDMTWIEGNLITGHQTVIRTGLPTPTWRKMYGGVQPTKSTRAKITDNCGMLEDYAEVDKALADLNGNTAEFRLSEDVAHIEGINQELQQTLMYGNEGTEPEAFTGFSPRFNDLSAANADNIILGGGSGTDNGSIWLVCWSPMTVHGIVPKGSTAGLIREDKGQVTIENVDGNGGRMEAYRTHYRFDAGLTVKDWRYVVRICNIDKSNLTPDATGSSAVLPDLLFEALELLPSQSMGRCAFYMARDMRTKVRQQLANKVAGSTLSVTQVGGVPVVDFQGVPLRRVDALAADEALVS